MTSGGSRNRSGPKPTDTSLNAVKKGLVFDALPSVGFNGEIPSFPLSAFTVRRWEYEDKRRFQVVDAESTEDFRDRELALWEWAWRTPQAHVWSVQPWRLQAIAQWVRTSVVCESSEASAADKGALHRFADQIGLTPAGLKENGWKISDGEQPVAHTSTSGGRSSSRGRLKSVPDAG